jgi:hypothetical protein
MEQQEGRLSGASLQKRAWLGVLILVLGVPSVSAPQVSSGQADSQGNAPDLNAIVQSLEAAEQQNPARARGYTMTRTYKLFHDDEIPPVSQTTAEISFVPPSTKRYEIKQSSGISWGKKLVRDILDLEIVPAQNSSEISRQNYEFVFLQQEELGGVLVYLLRMIPKRKEKNLLSGLVWVDTTTFRIQRIEGTPTKKASWWLKDLDITLQYADINGLWLPSYIKATAVVRLFGSYLLTGESVGLQLSASVSPKFSMAGRADGRLGSQPECVIGHLLKTQGRNLAVQKFADPRNPAGAKTLETASTRSSHPVFE